MLDKKILCKELRELTGQNSVKVIKMVNMDKINKMLIHALFSKF